jgi:aminopeptidase N
MKLILMKKLSPVLLLMLLIPVWSFADTYPKNLKVDILNYVFRITLSDNSDAIEVEATVDVLFFGEGVDILLLDLVKASSSLANKGMTVSKIMSEGKELSFTHEGDELKIKLLAPTQPKQRTTYTITYSGVPATGLKIANNKYGDRTFFSDNWPDKGRHWLPIVDHPYDKATCEFIITAPSHYQVVSNGLRIEEADLSNGNRITHWRQSVPISSWLYVLGVARFAVQQVDQFENKSIETWVYYQDRKAGFYDFAVPTKQVLEFFSDRIGPFAYEKLANIQSNSVSGGMEAASAILYSEKSVVGDRNEGWRNVIIHEIAHQWFGNAVTEYDWDDVWLSEGFATYFTLLFIEHQYGHDAFMKGLDDSKKNVLAFHTKNPTYRIVHDNLQDMDKVTSSHTYQKGSWILHMLRGVMGEENFWKGIRSYYSKYMNSSATTTDFRREMERASGIDLKAYFEQWLYKPGSLQCNGYWSYNEKKKEIHITLDQVQTDGSLFKIPMEVAVYLSAGKPLIKTLQLNEKRSEFFIPVDAAPENVLLDPNNWVLMELKWGKR